VTSSEHATARVTRTARGDSVDRRNTGSPGNV
jgi:hypothetical protein